MNAASPVPVTVLTGFLGSGKTTVLNVLLRRPAFGRAVVIVNEFGEIGLDHELVVSSTESLVLLQSGCMCCSLRGDLLETMLELSERREAGELDFERVVIETSGLADPAPILHTLLTHRALAQTFLVDGVVATVDAATGWTTLTRHEEARAQAALADLILLTKTDLPEADAPAVRAALAGLNPSAPVRTAIAGEIDPAALSGLGHFDPAMKSSQVSEWIRSAPGDAPTHLDAIRSVSREIDTPVSANQFDFWMTLLMARRGEDILRFKALIHLADGPYPFVVHGVRHIFHPPVLLKDWKGGSRRSKLVMIVRGFTDPELEDLFAALEAFPALAPVPSGEYLAAEASA